MNESVNKKKINSFIHSVSLYGYSCYTSFLHNNNAKMMMASRVSCEKKERNANKNEKTIKLWFIIKEENTKFVRRKKNFIFKTSIHVT